MSRPRRECRSPDQLSLLAVPQAPGGAPKITPPYAIPHYRVALVREALVSVRSIRIGTSRDAAALVRDQLTSTDREHFLVFLLDRKNILIGVNTVSVGSLTAAVVHPREVFKPAILSNAASILCAHNHPSGEPQPSQEDRTLTTRLVQAGKILGIEILDHVIVGDGTTAYFSFADAGVLNGSNP